MKKIILATLFGLLLVGQAWADILYSTKSGNWSDATVWSTGAVPIEGNCTQINNTHKVLFDGANTSIVVGDNSTNPAIKLMDGGTLEYTDAVAANVTLTLKGDLNINGTFAIGNVTNPINASKKFVIKTNYAVPAVNGTYGILVNNGGKLNFYGAPQTYWKTKLDAGNATGESTLTTNVSTGWGAGDMLVVGYMKGAYASSDTEKVNVSSVSGTTITLAAPLLYNHSTNATVFKLNKPIVVTSNDTAARGYFYETSSGARCNFSNVEFSYMGSNLSTKYGIKMSTGLTTQTYSNFTMHECYRGWDTSNAEAYTLDNFAAYNVTPSWAVWIDYKYVLYRFTNGIIAKCAGGIGGQYTRSIDLENMEIWSSVNGFYNGNNGNSNGNITNSTFYKNTAGLNVGNGAPAQIINNCSLWGNTNGIAMTYTNFLLASHPYTDFMQNVVPYSLFMVGCTMGIPEINSDSDLTFYTYGGDMFLRSINSAFNSTTLSKPGWNANPSYAFDTNVGKVSGRHRWGATNNPTSARVGMIGLISDHITGGQVAAWAYGGSGTSLYMNPASATAGNFLIWEFYIPVTAATDPQLKFYVKKTSSAANCAMTIDIYDTDEFTKLVNNTAVTLTDTWAQYSAASISPTNSGVCRVQLKTVDGSPTGDIGIDDVSVVISGTTSTDNINTWFNGLPKLNFDRGGGAPVGGSGGAVNYKSGNW